MLYLSSQLVVGIIVVKSVADGGVAVQFCASINVFAAFSNAFSVDDEVIALCTHSVVGMTVVLLEPSGSTAEQYCNCVSTLEVFVVAASGLDKVEDGEMKLFGLYIDPM